MDARARANITIMSEPARTPKSALATPLDEGLPLDAFFYEGELSRKRAEARKRAVKQWLSRFVKRSRRPQ
jgi:hypothetical protein